MRPAIFIIMLAVGGLGVTGFYAVRRVDHVRPESEARIVHPERRSIASTVNATGTIRLRVGSEVRVGSQLSGIVKR